MFLKNQQENPVCSKHTIRPQNSVALESRVRRHPRLSRLSADRARLLIPGEVKIKDKKKRKGDELLIAGAKTGFTPSRAPDHGSCRSTTLLVSRRESCHNIMIDYARVVHLFLFSVLTAMLTSTVV